MMAELTVFGNYDGLVRASQIHNPLFVEPILAYLIHCCKSIFSSIGGLYASDTNIQEQ
jgi:hypothetical protein